jgi:Holliday junction resolvase
MSGRRSRDKGARTERAIAKLLQANGFTTAEIAKRARA